VVTPEATNGRDHAADYSTATWTIRHSAFPLALLSHSVSTWIGGQGSIDETTRAWLFYGRSDVVQKYHVTPRDPAIALVVSNYESSTRRLA